MDVRPAGPEASLSDPAAPRRGISLNAVAWAGTGAVLISYAFTALGGNPLVFHCANAIGGIPLIAVQLRARVFQPLTVTVAFTAIGWVGVVGHYLTS